MSIPFQALETVSRQCRKRSEVHSRIEDVQLAKRLALDCFEPARSFPVKKAFGVRATERLDHIPSLYLFSFHVNQYSPSSAGGKNARFSVAGIYSKCD